MKLAFSGATDDVASLYGMFGEIGFNGLQLKWNQFGHYLDRPQQFVDQYGHIPGVASAVIGGWSPSDNSTAALRKTFEFGRTAGTELVIICLALDRDTVSDDDIRSLAGSISEFGREAIDLGLKLSVHNHAGQPVMRRPDFQVFFDATAEGTVGLTLDTAHAAKSGIDDLAELIRATAGYLDNFHMKDLAENEFKVLGEGGIDFDPIFKAIEDIGYDGWVSADEESGADVGGALKTCHDFLTAGLGGAK